MLATADLQTILLELTLLFGLCIVVGTVFHRLRMPPMVGFLAAGALVGPHGLGLVGRPEMVEQLAEIGVIVLLFTVGMELSLAHIRRLRRVILVAGGLQLGLTIVLGAGVAMLTGQPFERALFLGFLLSLSSTAAITKLLSDGGQIGTPAGRMTISVCVAQDLAVVPMILALPLLAGGDEGFATALAGVALAFGVLALTAAITWWVVPKLLGLVSRTRSRELFVLTVIVLCLGVSLVTGALGLSLALGAFIAGVVLGSSEFRHQAVSEVEPFRDALASLFFVSIGMLFDGRVFLDDPVVVVAALSAVVVGKAAIAYFAIRALKTPRWLAERSGLMLAQVGEFSFVIVMVASHHDLLTVRLEKTFFVVAVLSIMATPLLFTIGRKRTRRSRVDSSEPKSGSRELSDHVVLVGFGPAGHNLALALTALDIPYCAIEMNAETVKARKSAGVPIEFGDSTRPSVMRGAGIQRARILVLAINDPEATRRTATLARRLSPNVHIIGRAGFIGDIEPLRRAGADEVVPQELETSVELMVRALRRYVVPDDEIDRHVRTVRSETFGIPKLATPQRSGAEDLAAFPGLGLRVFRVESQSLVADAKLADSTLRQTSGVNIVAIKRGDETMISIDPELILETGDVVVVIGPEDGIDGAGAMFRGPVTSEEVASLAGLGEAEPKSLFGIDATEPTDAPEPVEPTDAAGD